MANSILNFFSPDALKKKDVKSFNINLEEFLVLVIQKRISLISF